MGRVAAAVAVLFLLVAPSAGAWTWPVVGPVLQPFVFDPAQPYAGGAHRGVDIGADAGATVVAPVDGTITFAGTVPSSGKSLSILTADALSVTLTHLGSLAVAKGAAVSEGSAVGTAGSSGAPELTVPYVHLGVRRSDDANAYLDPLGLLPPIVVDAPPAPAPPPVSAPPPDALPAPADTTTPPDTAPAGAAPVETSPVETTPVETAPVETTPVETTPVQATPVEATPPVTAPTATAPALAPVAPAPAAPVEALPQDVPAVQPPAEPAFDPAAPTAFVDPADAMPSLPGTGTGDALPVINTVQAVAAAPIRRPHSPGPAGPARLADPVALRTGLPAPAAPRPTPVVGRAHGRVAPQPTRVVGAATVPIRRALPSSSPHAHRRVGLPFAPTVATVAAVATLAALLTVVRMLLLPSATREGASTVREDPRCAGVAVCERPAAHRPRGGLRRAGRRLRALPPVEGRRRPHGERHRRARNAGDGVGGPRGRVSA